MANSLEPADTDAITRAVSLLRDAGYRVPKATKGTTVEDGVGFTLELEAPTRYSNWQNGGILAGGHDDGE